MAATTTETPLQTLRRFERAALQRAATARTLSARAGIAGDSPEMKRQLQAKEYETGKADAYRVAINILEGHR